MNTLEPKDIASISRQALKGLKLYPGAEHFFQLNNLRKLEDAPSTVFNYKIKGEISVLDQARTGRCWLFASLNILRLHLIKTLKLNSGFKLSANYLNFWSLFEKSNSYLCEIVKTKHLPLDDRHVEHILDGSICEGGTWQFSSQIIKKYGIVPEYIMPETGASSSSTQVLHILQMKLGVFAKEIRSKKSKSIDVYLQTVYEILVLFLGRPPLPYDEITWEYERNSPTKSKNTLKDKSKQKTSRNMKYKKFCGTPVDMYKKLCKSKCDSKIALTNFPNLKQNACYRFVYEPEVVGYTSKALNVDIPTITTLAMRSIVNKNETVWVGANWSEYFGGPYLSTPQIDNIYPFHIDLDKKDSVQIQRKHPTHATLLRAVHVDPKTEYPDRWLMHNSHGNDRGLDGELAVTQEWFEKNIYEIVVDIDLLPKDLQKAYKMKPIDKNPWEIMA